MSRLISLFKKNEKGQSMVEFALVFPVLILILVGIIDFGWLFNGQITLTSAAREGARVAAVIKDEKTAKDAVIETINLSSLVVDKDDDIKFDYPEEMVDGVILKKVKVTVGGSIKPLVGLFIPDPFEMKPVDAYMKIE